METETIPKKKEELKDLYVEEEEDEGPPPCGIMGRYPVVTVMLFAAVGIAIGLGLSYWEPEDIDTKEKIVKWVGLIGDLFIRALKCVVLPLVFVNVILSVVDMVSLGRASSVGVSTIVLYLGTTVIASIIGIISIFCFKGLFTEGTFTDPGPATITLGCDIDGYLLTEMPDGSVTCSNSSSSASAFTIVDISKTFARVSSGARNDISLSDTVYDGVFTKIVSSNIVESFVEANFAAVVAFAIVFGVALAQSMHKARVEGEYTLLLQTLECMLVDNYQLDHSSYSFCCLVPNC
jgi:Na+/H+-dicarboxylate symporter